MALRQGSECFTKWTHVENGQVLSRRLHRIVLQTPDGRPQDDYRRQAARLHPDLDGARLCRRESGAGLSSRRSLLPSGPWAGARLPATDGWWLTREARSRLAALRQAIECSTRLDHVENGPPLHRQVRRIEVQTRGRLYVFKGKQLPEFIGVCTGQGYKGKHRRPDPLVPRLGLRWPPGAFALANRTAVRGRNCGTWCIWAWVLRGS